MRSFFLAPLALTSSLLVHAHPTPDSVAVSSPPTPPKITSLRISGSGCPNDSNSVKSATSTLGDTASFTLSQLRGDSTDNCQIHIESSGGSQGWQVAINEVAYGGNVALSSGSSLDTITQTFWSENATNTSLLKGSVACSGPALKDYVTVKSSTDYLSWSKCTGSDGNPGILNVNFRPVVQGNSGTYDFKQANWGLVWRQC